MQSNMRTSYFSDSEIDNLVISYTSFKGFILDTNTDNIRIKNIIIDSCFIKVVNFQTIGNFDSLRGLQIKNSGVRHISGSVFEYCCKNIQRLYLDNNLLEIVENGILNGLTQLYYLNLAENPLEYMETNAFDSIRPSLKKLNLKSTSLMSLEDFYHDMNNLNELILTETRRLSLLNTRIILLNSPRLQYLKLDESSLVSKFANLNTFFDDFELNLPDQTSLKYLDASAYGIHLDESVFFQKFNQSKNCLWATLLKETFVKVDPNHPCNCGLFYIYRNLTRFSFPFLNETLEYDSDLLRPFLHSYFRINPEENVNNMMWEWKEILQLLPKCYIQLLLESFSLNSIHNLEVKCGLWEHNFNCSRPPLTSMSPFSTFTYKNSTDLNVKTIRSPYTLPILICLIVFSLMIIIFSILQTKNKFSKGLQKKAQHSLMGLPQLPKEMNSILTLPNDLDLPTERELSTM